MWLNRNPSWIEEIVWHPQLKLNSNNNFLIIDEIVVDESFHKGVKEVFYDFIITSSYQDKIPLVFQETIVSPDPNISSLSENNERNFMLSGIRYIHRNEQLFTSLVYCKSLIDYNI